MEKSVVFKQLNQFVGWWWAGLKAWLPASWLNRQQERQIHLYLDESLLKLLLVKKSGEVEQTQQFDLSDSNIINKLKLWLKPRHKLKKILVLSPEAFLIKNVTLPVSVRENLTDVMRYEVEKHTPFYASQTFFHYRLKATTRQDTNLDVSLAVVPKRVAEPIIDYLASFEVTINGFLTSNQSAVIYVDIFNEIKEHSDSGRLFVWFASLSMTLLMVWLYLPVMQYEEATENIQDSLSVQKRIAIHTKEIQKKNEALFELLSMVDNALVDYQSRLNILVALTNLIPETSWLTHCEINNGHIRVRGYTDSVTELTVLLNKSKLFTSVRLNQTNNYLNKEKEQQSFDAVLILTKTSKENV